MTNFQKNNINFVKIKGFYILYQLGNKYEKRNLAFSKLDSRSYFGTCLDNEERFIQETLSKEKIKTLFT